MMAFLEVNNNANFNTVITGNMITLSFVGVSVSADIGGDILVKIIVGFNCIFKNSEYFLILLAQAYFIE